MYFTAAQSLSARLEGWTLLIVSQVERILPWDGRVLQPSAWPAIELLSSFLLLPQRYSQFRHLHYMNLGMSNMPRAIREGCREDVNTGCWNVTPVPTEDQHQPPFSFPMESMVKRNPWKPFAVHWCAPVWETLCVMLFISEHCLLECCLPTPVYRADASEYLLTFASARIGHENSSHPVLSLIKPPIRFVRQDLPLHFVMSCSNIVFTYSVQLSDSSTVTILQWLSSS